mgnify:CR=1 FL=1
MNEDLLLGNADCRVRVDAARGGRIASLCVYGEELLVGASDADDASIVWAREV